MYEVILDEKAIDFLNKLDTFLKERIYNKVMSTTENLSHFFERLKGKKCSKLRVWDYQVIADINENIKRIEVIVIGHRKKRYKQIENLR